MEQNGPVARNKNRCFESGSSVWKAAKVVDGDVKGWTEQRRQRRCRAG